jgi:hypothetical protein
MKNNTSDDFYTNFMLKWLEYRGDKTSFTGIFEEVCSTLYYIVNDDLFLLRR